MASFSFDVPDRSAASFLRLASGDRRLSESLFRPASDGVRLRSRFRLRLERVDDELLWGSFKRSATAEQEFALKFQLA